MADIIIWGCGQWGQEAYHYLKEQNTILGFADNDPQKVGSSIKVSSRRGTFVPVLSKEDVIRSNALIYIATKYAPEILYQLVREENVDVNRIRIFQLDKMIAGPWELLWTIKDDELANHYRKTIPTISIGKFLKECASEHRLDALTFIPGGSGVLDYALLKALMVRFNLQGYLEIGTYIGESMHVMSDVAKVCYSVTVPEDHPASMKYWCEAYQMVDYSNRLVNRENMKQFLTESGKFDFTSIRDEVDLFFIDGDHSYNGVFSDTKKVFEAKKEDAFIVWHDFKEGANQLRLACIKGAADALGEAFSQVYLFDNCACGIFVPERYRSEFDKFCAYEKTDLFAYEVSIKPVVYSC